VGEWLKYLFTFLGGGFLVTILQNRAAQQREERKYEEEFKSWQREKKFEVYSQLVESLYDWGYLEDEPRRLARQRAFAQAVLLCEYLETTACLKEIEGLFVPKLEEVHIPGAATY
jgi:hypothetical protein